MATGSRPGRRKSAMELNLSATELNFDDTRDLSTVKKNVAMAAGSARRSTAKIAAKRRKIGSGMMIQPVGIDFSDSDDSEEEDFLGYLDPTEKNPFEESRFNRTETLAAFREARYDLLKADLRECQLGEPVKDEIKLAFAHAKAYSQSFVAQFARKDEPEMKRKLLALSHRFHGARDIEIAEMCRFLQSKSRGRDSPFSCIHIAIGKIPGPDTNTPSLFLKGVCEAIGRDCIYIDCDFGHGRNPTQCLFAAIYGAMKRYLPSNDATARKSSDLEKNHLLDAACGGRIDKFCHRFHERLREINDMRDYGIGLTPVVFILNNCDCLNSDPDSSKVVYAISRTFERYFSPIDNKSMAAGIQFIWIHKKPFGNQSRFDSAAMRQQISIGHFRKANVVAADAGTDQILSAAILRKMTHSTFSGRVFQWKNLTIDELWWDFKVYFRDSTKRSYHRDKRGFWGRPRFTRLHKILLKPVFEPFLYFVIKDFYDNALFDDGFTDLFYLVRDAWQEVLKVKRAQLLLSDPPPKDGLQTRQRHKIPILGKTAKYISTILQLREDNEYWLQKEVLHSWETLRRGFILDGGGDLCGVDKSKWVETLAAFEDKKHYDLVWKDNMTLEKILTNKWAEVYKKYSKTLYAKYQSHESLKLSDSNHNRFNVWENRLILAAFFASMVHPDDDRFLFDSQVGVGHQSGNHKRGQRFKEKQERLKEGADLRLRKMFSQKRLFALFSMLSGPSQAITDKLYMTMDALQRKGFLTRVATRDPLEGDIMEYRLNGLSMEQIYEVARIQNVRLEEYGFAPEKTRQFESQFF